MSPLPASLLPGLNCDAETTALIIGGRSGASVDRSVLCVDEQRGTDLDAGGAAS